MKMWQSSPAAVSVGCTRPESHHTRASDLLPGFYNQPANQPAIVLEAARHNLCNMEKLEETQGSYQPKRDLTRAIKHLQHDDPLHAMTATEPSHPVYSSSYGLPSLVTQIPTACFTGRPLCGKDVSPCIIMIGLENTSPLDMLPERKMLLTGNRIVLPCSATARVTACRIHQCAYVENLYPSDVSNFSMPLIKPTFPSCTWKSRQIQHTGVLGSTSACI
jgi:hypothetical protein